MPIPIYQCQKRGENSIKMVGLNTLQILVNFITGYFQRMDYI